VTKTDLELAEAHRYVWTPGGAPGVNVTTISGLMDDGKSSAFAGSAVKITKAGGDYRAEWREKGERGTRVHGYIEAWLRGEDVQAQVDEQGFLDAAEKFILDHAPEPIETEAILLGEGYGGRADLIAVLTDGEWAGETVLLDWKTGASYPVEHTLQLAAYRFAAGIGVYDENGTLVDRRPVPAVDRCGCVYVREDGTYRLAWYPADVRAYRAFVCLLDAYTWAHDGEMKKLAKEARGG